MMAEPKPKLKLAPRPRTPDTRQAAAQPPSERLSKRVAELVPCSRREAEQYIEGGWVSVDGRVVEEPMFRVSTQKVAVDPDASLLELLPVTLLLHKPPGYDALAALGEAMEGFEVVPAHCLDSVIAHQPGARAPLAERHPWNALIECVSPVSDSAALREAMESGLARALDDGLIADAVIAANDRQADDFWALRDGISAAERAIGPAMQHDISVPVDAMPEFILAAAPAIEAEFPGTCAVAFGHLGDGNVHFHVLAPPGAARGAWEEADGKAVSGRVYDLVTQWGGSISAEHGIGQMKVDELARLHDPAALALMQAVKAALDPDNLLNPGKLLRAPPQG